LSSIDGPFAQADRLKAIWYHGLDYDYYDKYIATIKNISADDLLSIYQKYYRPEEYTEVVVA
jgi:predicted Zn-dependent peptidase